MVKRSARPLAVLVVSALGAFLGWFAIVGLGEIWFLVVPPSEAPRERMLDAIRVALVYGAAFVAACAGWAFGLMVGCRIVNGVGPPKETWTANGDENHTA